MSGKAINVQAYPAESTANTVVRRAQTSDVAGIAALVNEHARRGDLLPRSLASIYQQLDNWFVADRAEDIVGCVSLLHYTSGLVEVRSLAVDDSLKGNGLGSKLVSALIREARDRHVPKLFALTRAVPFFARMGFEVVGMAEFPEKVWHDCRLCPVRFNCDETAMVLKLM
jgi:amino-acid N-acetyltransferase